MGVDDIDIKAAGEGDALKRSQTYQSARPSGNTRAPLTDVPSHMRARRKTVQLPPIVPYRPIPEWMKRPRETG